MIGIYGVLILAILLLSLVTVVDAKCSMDREERAGLNNL